MKNLLKYIKPYRFQCIVGPFCKFSEAMLELILPTIMAYMIDQGVVVQNREVVFTYGILMIVMVFIGFGFSLVCQYNAAIASQGFGTDLRNAMMKKIMQFSFEEIDHFGSSTLINRIGNDVNQLQVAVAMLIRLLVRSPFLVLGAIVMAFFLDAKLAMILLITAPLIALVLYWFIKKTTPLYRLYQKKLDQFLNVLEQNLSGVRVIRAFLSQGKERKRFDDNNHELQIQMMKIARLSALLNPLTALIVNGAIVFLLWGGIISIPDMGIAPGTLVAFINYASQILLAIIATSNLIVIFTKAGASAQRVDEVLSMPQRSNEGTIAHFDTSKPAITFQDVTFYYPQGKRPALQNLSFEISNGERIGIIGGTGAGKSTLANLLYHFYKCDGIHLFAQPIEQYTQATLAQIMTFIPQKNELFSGTIHSNLLYGNPEASEAMMWEALNIAQAKSFVEEFEHGLQQRVEAQGKNLSGGQRQRLCIARALLKQSQILVFDDSFSALDFKTDANLRIALSQRKQTQLIISQRIGTILHCDRILVLDRGVMVGFDTHEALLKNCSVYQEICATQQMTSEVA